MPKLLLKSNLSQAKINLTFIIKNRLMVPLNHPAPASILLIPHNGLQILERQIVRDQIVGVSPVRVDVESHNVDSFLLAGLPEGFEDVVDGDVEGVFLFDHVLLVREYPVADVVVFDEERVRDPELERLLGVVLFLHPEVDVHALDGLHVRGQGLEVLQVHSSH